MWKTINKFGFINSFFMYKYTFTYHNVIGDTMYKRVSIIVLALSIVLCGFKSKTEEFLYKYEIVLNSNDTKDVIKGYLYKEYLIDQYNGLIEYLDVSLHTSAIKSNIDIFAKEGSYSEYKDGVIVVYVGDAKGDALTGSLKINSCDTSNIRVKFFFSKFFVK